MDGDALNSRQIPRRQRLFQFQERPFSWLGAVLVVGRGAVPAERGELFFWFGRGVVGHEQEIWSYDGVIVGLETG